MLQEGDIYVSGDGGRWQFNFYKRQHIKRPPSGLLLCTGYVYIYIKYVHIYTVPIGLRRERERLKGGERVTKPFIMLTAVHLLC